MLGLPYHEVMSPHRDRLEILTLSRRRQLHVATFIHRIIKNLCPQYFHGFFTINELSTRQTGLMIEKATRNYEDLSLSTGGARLFNKIDQAIRDARSADDFAKVFELFLLDEQCNSN